MNRLCLTFAFVALLPMKALAHHDSTVGRIDSPRLLSVESSELPTPRLDAAAGYTFSRFGRLLDGRETLDADGAISVHLVHVMNRVVLNDAWAMGALVPFGASTASTQDGEDLNSTGLGDMTLFVERRVWDDERFRLTVDGGLLLPTGRYDPDNALSISDLQTTDEGGLDLATFDTRSSLGADVWAARGGFDLRWVSTLIRPGIRVALNQPLSETSDGIRWGADVWTRLDAAASVFGDSLSINLGFDYRKHFGDRLDFAQGDEVPERRTVGGRDDVGAVVDLQVPLGEALSCGASARLPVWQRAGAIQWVETVSTSFQCAYGLAL